MTQEQHPITPPPELFKQWEDDILNERDNVDHVLDCAWRDGFRAGADQELEACCEWLDAHMFRLTAQCIRAARRPKPPRLKEQAIEALAQVHHAIEQPIAITIRRALEALPDD